MPQSCSCSCLARSDCSRCVQQTKECDARTAVNAWCRGCPSACAAACREEITWSLQTLNANALELNRLWHEHGYSSVVRLLDVSSVDLLDRLPVKVCGE